MNKIFKTDYSPSQVDAVLLVLRAAVAALMLTHGIPKLQMLLSGGEIQFPGVMGLSPGFSLFLTIFAEVVCSIFIFFGVVTRLAVIAPMITMLVAVFMIHGNDPFINKELGLLYLSLYLPLLILGSGKYSFDLVLKSI
ncbi:DoxX family protein [Christiangramia fulva]|uniref:DoxX family protein n=2 Tax=Christiangramia TaxID=292691 RepID=A0A2R3ZA67_9FLAO|nr:DoxX family protein [Christiangramia fulva]AVR47166.1 DoxX family protein [Christiangramia fulva]